jgi:hypothetical protein
VCLPPQAFALDGDHHRGGIEKAAPLGDVCMKGAHVSPDCLQTTPFTFVEPICGHTTEGDSSETRRDGLAGVASAASGVANLKRDIT